MTGISWIWILDEEIQAGMTEEELSEVYSHLNNVPDCHAELLLAARAFACAHTEKGSLSEEWDALEDLLTDDNRYTSFQLQVGSITVTNRVEYEGFIRKGVRQVLSMFNQYELIDDRDVTQWHCEMEFTMTQS